MISSPRHRKVSKFLCVPLLNVPGSLQATRATAPASLSARRGIFLMKPKLLIAATASLVICAGVAIWFAVRAHRQDEAVREAIRLFESDKARWDAEEKAAMDQMNRDLDRMKKTFGDAVPSFSR